MTKKHIQEAITKYLADNTPVGSNSYVGGIFDQNGGSIGRMTIQFNGSGRLGYIPHINEPKITCFSSVTKEGVNASGQLLEILGNSGEEFYGKATVSGGTHISGKRLVKAYSGNSSIDCGKRVEFQLSNGSHVFSSSRKSDDGNVQFIYYYPKGNDTDYVEVAAIIENGQKILNSSVSSIDAENMVSIEYDLILPGHLSMEQAFSELEKRFPGSEIVIDRIDYSQKNKYNLTLSPNNVKAIMECGIDPKDIASMYVPFGLPEGAFAIALNGIEGDGNSTGYNLVISAVDSGVKPDILGTMSKSFGWKNSNGSDLDISSIFEQLYEIEKSRKN